MRKERKKERKKEMSVTIALWGKSSREMAADGEEKRLNTYIQVLTSLVDALHPSCLSIYTVFTSEALHTSARWATNAGRVSSFVYGDR